jgi:uncharacterized protein YoxC
MSFSEIEMSHKLRALNKKIEELNSTMESFTNEMDLDETNTLLESLETLITSLETQGTTLDTDVTLLKGYLDNVETLLTAVSTAISDQSTALQADLTALQGYVDGLEGYTDDVEGKLDSVIAAVGSVGSPDKTLHTDAHRETSTAQLKSWNPDITVPARVVSATIDCGAGLHYAYMRWYNGTHYVNQLLTCDTTVMSGYMPVPFVIPSIATDIVITIMCTNSANRSWQFACAWEELSDTEDHA